MLLNIPCKFWFVVLSSPFCPKFGIRKTLKDLSWVLFSGNAFVLMYLTHVLQKWPIKALL